MTEPSRFANTYVKRGEWADFGLPVHRFVQYTDMCHGVAGAGIMIEE
jgi:hypothetical protein